MKLNKRQINKLIREVNKHKTGLTDTEVIRIAEEIEDIYTNTEDYNTNIIKVILRTI